MKSPAPAVAVVTATLVETVAATVVTIVASTTMKAVVPVSTVATAAEAGADTAAAVIVAARIPHRRLLLCPLLFHLSFFFWSFSCCSRFSAISFPY